MKGGETVGSGIHSWRSGGPSAPRPVLAIVGRPNVGKSTLFNRLVGRRAAIVEDLPGVTRDRQYGEGEVLGRELLVIDTGGLDPSSEDVLLVGMRRQVEAAIAEADVIVALFDGRAGLTETDREIVRTLWKVGKPTHYAVNKIDGASHDPLVAEFWELGVEALHPVSAQHGAGVLDLMEVVLETLPGPAVEDLSLADDGATRVAVVGRPNVGKSTLVNRLLGEERLLVDDAPGTTRDSIDTWIELPPDPKALAMARRELEAARRDAGLVPAQASSGDDPSGQGDGGEDSPDGIREVRGAAAWPDGAEPRDGGPPDGWAFEDQGADTPEPGLDEEGPLAGDGPPADPLVAAEEALRLAGERRRYLLIDTAGVRRRKWIKTAVERYSVVRAFKSIDRAEVCLLVLDATLGVTDQDAKLAGLVQAKGCACVVLVNKWDIVRDKDDRTAGAFARELRDQLPFIAYAPIIFISALTGQRVHRIMATVDRVKRNTLRRIPTGPLNRFIGGLAAVHQPPMRRGRRLKLLYATQVAVAPPTFLLGVNDRQAVHFSYQRFLQNRVRAEWDFEGTPIRFVLRERAGRGRKRRPPT